MAKLYAYFNDFQSLNLIYLYFLIFYSQMRFSLVGQTFTIQFNRLVLDIEDE